MVHLPPVTLLRLPRELLENIISAVDGQQDLISLALASRTCRDLVIPYHTEYRIIRIRSPMYAMWEHLARRADLTQNIREVHLCERGDYTAPDHYPTTLIEKAEDVRKLLPENWDEKKEEEERIRNVCEALSHMKRLQVFTWINQVDEKARLRPNPAHEDLVLKALRKARSLRHLALGGKCGSHVRFGRGSGGLSYPVWEISGLRSLSLKGTSWSHPSNASHMCRLLKQSPDLDFLDLPVEFNPQLSERHFPHLRRLKLSTSSSSVLSTTISWTTFLDNHPTIEELFWYPIGPVEISAASLPALKSLKIGWRVSGTLELTGRCRSIECLDMWSIDATDLSNMEEIDASRIRKIKLHKLGSLDSIYELATKFTGITWLSMPYFYYSSGAVPPGIITLDQWFDILPRFSNLEVFRGSGIWQAVGEVRERTHGVILELVRLCPKLRQLDHWDFYEKRRDFKRIRITRQEGSEGFESVRYEVHNPPPWSAFDVMDGTFD